MIERSYELTIIIPHYNTPVDLSRLLDSIGFQEAVQIIVVDDTSTQLLDELDICRRKYEHVLFLQTELGKKGAGAARNMGLRHALGKWLLFADSDDLFLPGWYDVVFPYMESDYDAVFFSPASIRRDGGVPWRHERYDKLVEQYLSCSYGGEERLRGHFTAPWSKLIRTSLVRENGIQFDEVFYSADVMFSAKVGYYAGKITAERTPFYCIVDHDDSMSMVKSSDVYCRRQKLYCERDSFFKTRWSKKQFNAYGRLCFLHSMKDTRKRGYDWKAVAAMGRIYKEYGIPLIVINYRKYADRLRRHSSCERRFRA